MESIEDSHVDFRLIGELIFSEKIFGEIESRENDGIRDKVRAGRVF